LNDSNKLTTSSSYSETLGSSGGFLHIPIQYSVNPAENMINYNNNRNSIKKSKDQIFNLEYNNYTSTTNNIHSQSKQVFTTTLASNNNNNLNGQKRQKVFYNKKPI
jgi:hypothetical protein